MNLDGLKQIFFISYGRFDTWLIFIIFYKSVIHFNKLICMVSN